MFEHSPLRSPISQPVLVNGSRYQVHSWPGEKPTITAFHGYTGTGDDYRGIATHLSHHMDAPDLIGHGQSAAPHTSGAYQPQAFVRDVAELSSKAELLMGYSLGARILLDGLCRDLLKPRAIVLISGTAGIEDDTERRSRQIQDDELALKLGQQGVRAFLDEWQEKSLIKSQANAPRILRQVMAAGRAMHEAHGLSKILTAYSPGRLPHRWDQLESLALPVLLIAGSNDQKYTDIAHRMAERLPQAEVKIIDNVGHAPHLEAPDRTARAINSFVKTAFSSPVFNSTK